MYRLLILSCTALADHSGFATRGPEGRRLCGGGGGGGGGALSPEECVLGAPRQGTAYLCASRADATKDNNYCFASWAYIDKDGADLKIVAHDFCRGRRLELVSLSLGSSPTMKLSLHAHYTSSSEASPTRTLALARPATESK